VAEVIANFFKARSEDIIRRKVLEKVATLTTQNLSDDDEPDHSVADSGETDMVLTTSSDADSSGGSKVVANSIDGEDELVDVTMNDVKESVESDASTTKISPAEKIRYVTSMSPIGQLAYYIPSPRPAPFNSRRPPFVPSDSYLPAELQNMFSMGYFVGSKEMVPTGWHTVDEDKTYPTLSSRNPQAAQSLDPGSPSGQELSNSRAGSEGSEDNDNDDGASNTRMVEESSDEDADIPATVPAKVSLHIYSVISHLFSSYFTSYSQESLTFTN